MVYPLGTIANALNVQIVGSSVNGPFELNALNGGDSANPFVGGAVGNEGGTFGAGSPAYAFLTGTSHTAANSPPANVGNSLGSASESTIWFIDCQTLEITAQWTNPDNSQYPATVFYDVSFGDFLMTGDVNAFVATFGDESSPVTLQFIPN